MGDMIEVRRGGYHLRPSVRVPIQMQDYKNNKNNIFISNQHCLLRGSVNKELYLGFE